MANLGYISGMQTVLKNLRQASVKIGQGVERGLIKGGQFLQAKSQEVVPVRFGILKASAFTRKVAGQGMSADIVVGYGTDYAVFVHENLDAAHGEAFNLKHADKIAAAAGTKAGTVKGGWFPRGIGQEAKFLERPARENRGQILDIVASEARKVR